MSKKSAQDCFKQANLTIEDIKVIELHDCFSANELVT